MELSSSGILLLVPSSILWISQSPSPQTASFWRRDLITKPSSSGMFSRSPSPQTASFWRRALLIKPSSSGIPPLAPSSILWRAILARFS
ncbi:hypothetical protein BDW68DRAFT_153725, partial [Aspergillus falconensis]